MTRATNALKFLPLFALLGAGTPVYAQQTQPVGAQASWCQIDDPGAWAKARQALITGGATELGDIPCAPKQGGASVPEVLHLPMPCGRTMVFQRIDVPVSHPLDQIEGNFGRAVNVASETPQTVLSNGAWSAPIAGSFTIARNGPNGVSSAFADLHARAYYIARYELTTVQYATFQLGLLDLDPAQTADPASQACAPLETMLTDMNLRSIPAQGDLSWFDAIDFSRDYSAWLINRDAARIAAGQAPDVPWEQGATGYVRLPTEAEWEYAARGGASQVTTQSRTNKLPAVIDADGETIRTGSLAELCADKPRTSGVLVGPVGRKLPNALGLYDVICNAEEIVLDLFRPTRPDGLSGQVGGVITKGGSSALFRERNTVGRRVEAAALFGLRGEGQSRTMGVRLAVASPVFSGRRDAPVTGATMEETYTEGRLNTVYEQALMEGRDELLEQGIGMAGGGSDELAAEVNKLRRSLSEGVLSEQQLSEQAERLQIELERLETRLNSEAQAATQLSIRSGVVTSNLIFRTGANVYNVMIRIEELLEEPVLTDQQRSRLERAERLIEVYENRIQASFDLYLQVHTELGARPASFVQRQLLATRSGVNGFNVDLFDQYLDLFEDHHAQVRNARGRLTEELREAWLDQLDGTRERRRNEFPNLQP